jgi:hypothetical protein
MSDLQSRPNPSGGAAFTRAGGEPTIQWIRSETVSYVPPQPAKAGRRGRGDNTTAMIVVGLTLASTMLALFDLFQLASGF